MLGLKLNGVSKRGHRYQVCLCPLFNAIRAITLIQVRREWQRSMESCPRYIFSENIGNLQVSCYNGNNNRAAWALFVKHPRAQGK